MKSRLVIVTWHDAYGSASRDFSHAPLVMTTVGWLLCKDSKGVAIANERQEDGAYRGQTFIPAGMVQRIKTIRTKEAV